MNVVVLGPKDVMFARQGYRVVRYNQLSQLRGHAGIKEVYVMIDAYNCLNSDGKPL